MNYRNIIAQTSKPTLNNVCLKMLIHSTDFVEGKIEEFLAGFGEKMASLSEEAFKTQVTALVKLKECEDSHLGEEVDRHWFEVFTQQYVFHRLHKEVGDAHRHIPTFPVCIYSIT